MNATDPRSVYDRLRHHSLTHEQACGILGNIQQESGFRTHVEGFDHTGSFGLCQWLGSRKSALERFARARTLPATDWEVQVDFIMHELHGTEKHAWESLQRCATAAAAALCFCNLYERPSKRYANVRGRIKYAQEFDEQFRSKAA